MPLLRSPFFMNNSHFIALFFAFFAVCSLSAQINVRLKDGSNFLIEGKEIFKSANRGNCYLRETADTLHYYVHRAASADIFTLEHYRIPTRYLSKAESKKTKARFLFKEHVDATSTFFMLSFHCTEKGNDMLKDFQNRFLLTYYSQSETGRAENVCHISMYFSDKTEAQAANKRIKELAK